MVVGRLSVFIGMSKCLCYCVCIQATTTLIGDLYTIVCIAAFYSLCATATVCMSVLKSFFVDVCVHHLFEHIYIVLMWCALVIFTIVICILYQFVSPSDATSTLSVWCCCFIIYRVFLCQRRVFEMFLFTYIHNIVVAVALFVVIFFFHILLVSKICVLFGLSLHK